MLPCPKPQGIYQIRSWAVCSNNHVGVSMITVDNSWIRVKEKNSKNLVFRRFIFFRGVFGVTSQWVLVLIATKVQAGLSLRLSDNCHHTGVDNFGDKFPVFCSIGFSCCNNSYSAVVPVLQKYLPLVQSRVNQQNRLKGSLIAYQISRSDTTCSTIIIEVLCFLCI